MFRTFSASIIRSVKICSNSHWCMSWATDLRRPYLINIIPTYDMHQWLLLQILALLMMDAESVRNMLSDLAVTNKQYSQIHQPTLMNNFLYSLTICLLHYYPRHVSSIKMSIFRRKNCTHTASGIFALCKRLQSKLVESGLTSVRSQPVYCADVYRERRYQMLCKYNFSS